MLNFSTLQSWTKYMRQNSIIIISQAPNPYPPQSIQFWGYIIHNTTNTEWRGRGGGPDLSQYIMSMIVGVKTTLLSVKW